MLFQKFSSLRRLAGLTVLPALLVCGAVVSAQAATPQFGLFNTGIDPGVMLGVDNHYTVSLEGATTPLNAPTYVTDLTNLPYSPADSPASKFVSPRPSYAAGQVDAGGYYNFITTFDLTGVNLNLVSIQGRFQSDDIISDVILNGHSLGISMADNISYGHFSSYYNLVPNSGFLQNGTNTLDFRVYNYAGTAIDPVALRAEFLSAVPEPSVWAGVISMVSIACLGNWLRRRQAAV